MPEADCSPQPLFEPIGKLRCKITQLNRKTQTNRFFFTPHRHVDRNHFPSRHPTAGRICYTTRIYCQMNKNIGYFV
jgi:hypothetical protein